MKNNLVILISIFLITLLLPTFSIAETFSQTIGDDDNFGWAPDVPSSFGWDKRSLDEQNANNGAQYTDWDGVVYQKQFVFDFGTAIVDIVQANIEMNAYDIEDAQGDHIDIQFNVEGYDVPGAFDDVDLRFTSGIISFDLLNILGLDALEDICSDGVVTVDFLNAGSYQEYYAIDWVSLSIEGAIESPTICKGLADYDSDVDGTDAFMFKSHFGRSLVKNPCPPNGPAPVPKTGQSTCYEYDGGNWVEFECAGTGQDGEYQRGVPLPVSRHIDNGDGTITDRLTGLMWLEDSNCMYTNYPSFDSDGGEDGKVTWLHALDFVSRVNDGTYPNCGAGYIDWRTPNVEELLSLVDHTESYPALSSDYPFDNVSNDWYWTSTTCDWGGNGEAFAVEFGRGRRESQYKDYRPIPGLCYVWQVRGGH